jgi:hypothetical protein
VNRPTRPTKSSSFFTSRQLISNTSTFLGKGDPAFPLGSNPTGLGLKD